MHIALSPTELLRSPACSLRRRVCAWDHHDAVFINEKIQVEAPHCSLGRVFVCRFDTVFIDCKSGGFS